MVNLSADDVDTMVDDQPILLNEQGQKMRKHTPWRQHMVPAPRSQTPERCLSPRNPEPAPLMGLEHMGLLTPQKPRPAMPTLEEAEAARNTSDMNVDQQLLGN
jgi:hypothetical protein